MDLWRSGERRGKALERGSVGRGRQVDDCGRGVNGVSMGEYGMEEEDFEGRKDEWKDD
jgi:hypothetical protein